MRTRALLGTILIAAAGLAACGGDDDEATRDEWFAAVCAAAPGEPAFDQFFAEHPEPTLEDWAAFLPGIGDDLRAFADAAVSTPHPGDMDDELDDAAKALRTVAQNFDDSAAAAAAGDADRFAELEAKNQDVDVPAMEAAMAAVEPRECSDQGE